MDWTKRATNHSIVITLSTKSIVQVASAFMINKDEHGGRGSENPTISNTLWGGDWMIWQANDSTLTLMFCYARN